MSAGEADGCLLSWGTPARPATPTRPPTFEEHCCLLDAGHEQPGPDQEDHACTCGATYPAALDAPERLRRRSG